MFASATGAFGAHGVAVRVPEALLPAARTENSAPRAATARWVRGTVRSEPVRAILLCPVGDVVDEGTGRPGVRPHQRREPAGLAGGAAAAAREGVPVTNTQPDPELRLYRLLSSVAGDLGVMRAYNARLRLIVSFADACSVARSDAARREAPT